MKKYFFIAVTALLVSACNQGEIDRSKADLSLSNRERDSLKKIADEREESMNAFVYSFNEIERNLNAVAVKQHIIMLDSDKQTELKMNQRARINEQIKSINTLMDLNRKMIADLNTKLRNSGLKNTEFEKTIVMLNEQLTQKGVELMDLNDKLNVLNAQMTQLKISIDTLTLQNYANSQSISEKTMALHTAYYVIGKSRDLQAAKIIDRKGGLLGIGKTSKLSEDFEKSKFKRIDYTEMTTIPINSNDVKIVTGHPSDSYTLDKDSKDEGRIKNLVITNPEKFWSVSKYLVIVKS